MRPSPDITTIASNWSNGSFSTTSLAWFLFVVTGMALSGRKERGNSIRTSHVYFALCSMEYGLDFLAVLGNSFALECPVNGY